MKDALYVGTMSGTSADGLDIVIAQINNVSQVLLRHSYFHAYPKKLQIQIRELQSYSSDKLFNQYKTNLDSLNSELALFFSKHIQLCLDQANINPSKIQAIGNHGQTILHQPNAKKPYSLQICDAQQLANHCAIPVISHFRQADIEQKGQGAPLMPSFHSSLFNEKKPCAVVNIGGISNTTLLFKNHILGFDNGPGNTLMDAWIDKHHNERFDENGLWAKSGKTHQTLLDELLNDGYFKQTHPKSTGQDKFNLSWLEAILSSYTSISKKDIQTTLCDLTAKCIANDLNQYASSINNIYVCGGGVKNTFLMERIKHFAGTNRKVTSTNALKVDPDWVEALGFAWLAYCHQHQIEGNIPNVTGAKKAVILGQRFDPKPPH